MTLEERMVELIEEWLDKYKVITIDDYDQILLQADEELKMETNKK